MRAAKDCCSATPTLRWRYDSATKSLVVNPPGWWVINYPFTRIQGLESKSADQISQLLFGAAREVRNWYVKTPEESELVSEPAAPTQPAPIELTQGPALVVINRHPQSSRQQPGNPQGPAQNHFGGGQADPAGHVNSRLSWRVPGNSRD